MPVRARRLVARALLLAASLALGLLAAELAVRLLLPQAVLLVTPGLYALDPPRRYRLSPGFRGAITNRVEFDTTVAVDADGLRIPVTAPADGGQKPGAARILAVGDSFTFGVGAEAEESYPARLAAALAAAGVDAEVLNAGVPGFGVPDAAAWFAAHGAGLAPDIAVLGVFVGNDLQDAAGPGVEVVDGLLVARGERPRSLSRWLYYHSHLYVLLKGSPLGPLARRALGRQRPLEEREVEAELGLYARESPPPAVAAGIAATERAVADFAAIARGRGVRAAAVLVPSLLQVDERAWRAALDGLDRDPAGYDRDRPSALFADLFARHGVPALDLAAPFREAIASGRSIYWPVDRHLTPAGYDLMGREAARFLLARGLVAPPPGAALP